MHKLGLKTEMTIELILVAIAGVSELMVYAGIDTSSVGLKIFYISLGAADIWWAGIIFKILQVNLRRILKKD